MRALAQKARIARPTADVPLKGTEARKLIFLDNPLYVKNVDSKADKIQLRNINKGFCKCFD
jgi:hypothetical protein